MSFQTFVRDFPGGRLALAKALGRSPEAVRLWMIGQRTPNSTTMKKLIEISRGKITPDEFFDMPPKRRVA